MSQQDKIDEFAGHTPEPWTVFTTWSQQTGSGFAIEEQRGDESSQEAEANARLLGAAPRLLRENRELRAERDALKAELAQAERDAVYLAKQIPSLKTAELNAIAERDALKAENDALAETAARLRAALGTMDVHGAVEGVERMAQQMAAPAGGAR